MMKIIFLILLTLSVQSLKSQSKKDYFEDFNFLWNTLREDYCYWDKKQTNWEKVKEKFSPLIDTITSRKGFVLFLEKVFNEIYDHHASLNTNTSESQRLVPSGTDIWAEMIGETAFIKEVRKDFGADKCGLRQGMEIIAFNNEPIGSAIQKFLPTCMVANDEEANNYALRVLLAGKFIDDRVITVKDRNGVKDYYPDRPTPLVNMESASGLLDTKFLENNIGYIRINNRLWNIDLIGAFDSVMNKLSSAKAFILDLRETPSGGNTTVARAILGSFIQKEGFYQRHELTAEETMYGLKRSWVEIVSPRKVNYKQPLIVLVNHWTGSVGEGITIGFKALRRATIVGTTMARLNGAIYSYQMPNTKIGFSIPVEKLFDIRSRPREDFYPDVWFNPDYDGERDNLLEVAIREAKRKIR